MRNIWRDGILGVVVGDALGEPVQFESREEVARHPITGMRGYGTFNLPAGSWTDDSSLTLATLDAITNVNTLRVNDVADRFVEWLNQGKYTPYGYAYDIGRGCYTGIKTFEHTGNPLSGEKYEDNNGNGSLMRILPVCLYCYMHEKSEDYSEEYAVLEVEKFSEITHGHKRAKVACGIYYFLIKAILQETGSLIWRMQKGIDNAFEFYRNEKELSYYRRLENLKEFARTPESQIKSTGYVVDTLEAAVWSLINTNSFESALLMAVNLGYDTDTVGAIAGGLAGLYYGSSSIPDEWVKEIQRINWIEGLCNLADIKMNSAN